jgi:excisionase family DNA binding protein
MSEEIQPMLLRIGAVSSMLGMSRSSIYREIHNGNLKAFKIGKSLRISQEEVSRYVSNLSVLVTAHQ